MVAGDRRSASPAAAPAGRASKALVTADVSDGSRPPAGHVLQPGLAGAAAAAGHRGGPLRQGRQLPGPPADDEPGRRPGRRPHRAHRPDLPAVREGRLTTLGHGRLDGGGAATGPASFAEPVPERVLDRLDLVDRTGAFRGIHVPESMGERRRGPQAAGVRRAAAHPARAGPAQAGARARRPRASRHDVDGRARAAASTSALPFPLTGAQQRAIGEITADLPARTRCTACSRATSARARRVVAVSALLVAVQGGHQGALMAPTEVLAEQHHLGVRALLDGLTRRRRRRHRSSATGRCGSSCSPTARPPTERTRLARRPRRRRGRPRSSAPTR